MNTSTIVLIHGAWHGAWCWEKVKTILSAKGHTVIAPDLPGHGEDGKEMCSVALDDYINAIVDILQTQETPVYLLGHSMGGFLITAAAEQCPDKIAKLIYLTAFLPVSGESLFAIETRNRNPSVAANLIFSKDRLTASIRDDKIIELLYHDCTAEDAASAKARLCPQALAPLSTPVNTTIENFGRIPRVYIECLDDRGIHIELQRDMQKASPCYEVYSLNSSHSPFISMPGELAGLLTAICTVDK